MEVVQVSGQVPLFVVCLHRLARLGMGTVYGGIQNRLVQFVLEGELGDLTKRYSPLHDVEKVYLIYRERGK